MSRDGFAAGPAATLGISKNRVEVPAGYVDYPIPVLNVRPAAQRAGGGHQTRLAQGQDTGGVATAKVSRVGVAPGRR
jgi:hypothetical protein